MHLLFPDLLVDGNIEEQKLAKNKINMKGSFRNIFFECSLSLNNNNILTKESHWIKYNIYQS